MSSHLLFFFFLKIAIRPQPQFDQRPRGRLEAFSGLDTVWPAWSFEVRPYSDSISLIAADKCCAAEVMSEHPWVADQTPQEIEHARTMYILLVPGCSDRALTVCKRIERNKGFAVRKEVQGRE